MKISRTLRRALALSAGLVLLVAVVGVAGVATFPCTLVGCLPGVTFIAHLDEPAAAVAESGTFHVCHQGQCWDGTFLPKEPAWRCSVESSFAMQLHCDLGPEGSGSQIRLWVASDAALAKKGGGGFRDGDPVVLQLDVGGRRVVDQRRNVSYRNDYPNGRLCGGGCRIATVELWPGSPSGQTCESNGCDPVVRMETTLPVTRDGAGHTTVTACKNGDCKESRWGILWSWDDAKNAPVPQSNRSGGVERVDGSDVRISTFSTSRPVSAPYDVTIEFRGDTRAYKAGDTYSVEWKGANGKVLFKVERVVTKYDESYPGGQACTPVACRTKDFGSIR